MFIQVRCVCDHFIINLGITDHEDISIVVDDDAIQSMETGEPTVAADSGTFGGNMEDQFGNTMPIRSSILPFLLW